MEFEINNDFDFNLPNKRINILDDNILFNKSKISDDVLSMSSREDVSIADEIESEIGSEVDNNYVFKQASMGSNSDEFSEISIDDIPKSSGGNMRESARNTIQDEITEKKRNIISI